MNTTSRPRGRPRTFDRPAALDAAMRVFWRHGYDGTSIADLTEAMGFTAPTLYAAFGSKEELYRDALQHYQALGAQAQRWAMSEDVAAYEAVEQYLHIIADSFTDTTKPPGCMLQTASLYCAAENESARTTAAGMRASALELLVAKLDWAKETGELPAHTDTLALARFYSAIIQGMSVQAIDGASADALHRLVEVAMAAWPRGQATGDGSA